LQANRDNELFRQMRLVAMPSYSNTGIIFRAKNLFYPHRAARLRLSRSGFCAIPDSLGLLKPLSRSRIEAERCAAPLALERAIKR
jgi:hypothetical protein